MILRAFTIYLHLIYHESLLMQVSYCIKKIIMTHLISSGMKCIALVTVFAFISSCFAQNKSNEETKLTETGCVTAAKPFVKMKTSSFQSVNFLNQQKPGDDLQVSKYIRSMLQDKKGNIWFGTNDDGVCRYDGKDFVYFTEKDGLAGNAVRKILLDEAGVTWFATNGGVTRYDGKGFTNFTVKDGLTDNDVWSMLKDRNGNIWFGTMKGLCRYDGTTFTFIKMPEVSMKTKSRFTPKLVWSMYEDKTGNLWFGTDGGGLLKYDGASFTTITDKDGLCGNNILSITQDKAGNLWFGSWGNGVSRYNGTAFTNFTMDNGLCSNEIWTMMQDKKGNIWFGSLGSGISCYSSSSVPNAQAGFSNFSENKGLTKNHVQSILEDKDGNLWFGFSGGVFLFDGKQLINFTKPGC